MQTITTRRPERIEINPPKETLAVKATGKRFQEYALVLCAHFCLTVLFTFPLIIHFTSALPGQLLVDRDQNLWNLWWVKQALSNFQNPFYTDLLYYPSGVSLYFHTLNPLNGLLSIPVQLLFGLTAAYNYIVFFSFVMAGLGCYLLLRYLGNSRKVALAASLIFVYAPYHLGTLKGLMQLISLEWLPFYILFLLKACREGQNFIHNCLLAALFLVLTAFTDWYYTLFLLIFTLIYFGLKIAGDFIPLSRATGYNSVQSLPLENGLPFAGNKAYFNFFKTFTRKAGSFRSILALGLTGLIFSLAMLPVLGPMLAEMRSTSYYMPDPQLTRDFSADLLAFFLPPTTSTFLGWIISPALKVHYVTGPLAAQVYLGYFALGFSILGLIVSKPTRLWGFTGLVFWLLSLGPALRVNGPNPGWPMPYALIENLPVVNITRSPDRFVVITMLCLAVCAAGGLDWLAAYAARRHTKKAERLVAGTAAFLIVVEFLQAPYPVNNYEVSPFFRQLGLEPAQYSLLELPAQDGLWTGGQRMAEQAVHDKLIFGGYISREYDHPFERNTPGFRQLTVLERPYDITLPAGQENAGGGEGLDPLSLAAFDYYKVKYVILRSPQTPKQLSSGQEEKYRQVLQRLFPAGPVYKDEWLEAYEVPANFGPARPFVEISAGSWYEPEQRTASSTGGPITYRWASGNTSLNLVWGGTGETAVNLSLTLGLLEGEKPATISFDGKTIWQGNLKAGAPSLLTFPVSLTPGQHLLKIAVDGKPITPKSLKMGNDQRKLLYFVQEVKLS